MEASLVSLSTIKQGAAQELFDHALTQVLDNIKDPNAAPTKKRKITLVFEFDPHVDRSGAHVQIAVKTNLVPVNAVATTLFLGMQDGEYKAFTHDIRQEDLFQNTPLPEGVTAMPQVKAQ